jgi:hypothetical protein
MGGANIAFLSGVLKKVVGAARPSSAPVSHTFFAHDLIII